MLPQHYPSGASLLIQCNKKKKWQQKQLLLETGMLHQQLAFKQISIDEQLLPDRWIQGMQQF